MLNALLGDSRLEMLQRALGGLTSRQQALASNIANVDTPGYRRKDVAFESELGASLSRRGGADGMATTSAGQMALPRSSSGGLLSNATAPDQGRTRTSRNDDNDVDIDYEMTRLAETSLRYQLLTQATSTRFTTLQAVAGRG